MPYGIQAPAASGFTGGPSVLGQLMDLFGPDQVKQRQAQTALMGAQTSHFKTEDAYAQDKSNIEWYKQFLLNKGQNADEAYRWLSVDPLSWEGRRAEDERNRITEQGQLATNQIEQTRNDILGTEARNLGQAEQQQFAQKEEELALQKQGHNMSTLQSLPMLFTQIAASPTLPPEAKAMFSAIANNFMKGMDPQAATQATKTISDEQALRQPYLNQRHGITSSIPGFANGQPSTQGGQALQDLGNMIGSTLLPNPVSSESSGMSHLYNGIGSMLNPVGAGANLGYQGLGKAIQWWNTPLNSGGASTPATSTPAYNQTKQLPQASSGVHSSQELTNPPGPNVGAGTGITVRPGTTPPSPFNAGDSPLGPNWTDPIAQPGDVLFNGGAGSGLQRAPSPPAGQPSPQFHNSPPLRQNQPTGQPPLSMLQLQAPGGPTNGNPAALAAVMRMLGMSA